MGPGGNLIDKSGPEKMGINRLIPDDYLAPARNKPFSGRESVGISSVYPAFLPAEMGTPGNLRGRGKTGKYFGREINR